MQVYSLSIIHSLLLLIAHLLPLKCLPLKDRNFIIKFTASSVLTTIKCITVLNEQMNTSDPSHSNSPLPNTFPLTLSGNRGCYSNCSDYETIGSHSGVYQFTLWVTLSVSPPLLPMQQALFFLIPPGQGFFLLGEVCPFSFLIRPLEYEAF